MYALPSRVNHQNALNVRIEGLSVLGHSSTTEHLVSAKNLINFDSSALAVILAFKRAFPDLMVTDASAKLCSLSKIYGLDEVLDIVPSVVQL